MADQLNMNGLSLKDSNHAGAGSGGQGPQQNGFGEGRSAYIPPHLRSRGGGPPPTAAGAPNGMNGADFPPPKYVFIGNAVRST